MLNGALHPYVFGVYYCLTFLFQVREGADEQNILSTVHSIYNDIGVKDLTVEIEIYE